MNKATLYLKHRPVNFKDVIGNEDIIAVLLSQLEGESAPHSLMFHGPTGCGKTTLARIVAHQLGARGSDLREVDSADFRGIEMVRDIRRQSAYRPLEGSCKVWILDEAHQLTRDAQTALLKALEDTPPHVYYILCTTQPEKLLPTIRGRCAQYQVNPLNEREMKILLRTVVKAEEESLPKEVYEQIVQDSLGHPRNALQILAQVLAVNDEKRLEVARRVAEKQSQTIELCRALVGNEPWAKISGILKGLKNEDSEGIRRAVLGYCQSVILSSKRQDGVAAIMEEFIQPFYDSGFPGLVLACYSVLFGGE